MRRLAALLLLCASGICTNALPASAADNACRRIYDTSQLHVLSVVHDTSLSAEQKRAKLLKVFDDLVDTNWVAQTVAGPFWQKASESERKNYLSVYRDFISGYYIGSLDEGDFATIKDIKLDDFTETEANTYDMQIELVQSDDAPDIIYLHLVEAPAGSCHVRDFKVEGVSLLVSQTDELQSLGANGGLPNITEQLSAHIAKRKH